MRLIVCTFFSILYVSSLSAQDDGVIEIVIEKPGTSQTFEVENDVDDNKVADERSLSYSVTPVTTIASFEEHHPVQEILGQELYDALERLRGIDLPSIESQITSMYRSFFWRDKVTKVQKTISVLLAAGATTFATVSVATSAQRGTSLFDNLLIAGLGASAYGFDKWSKSTTKHASDHLRDYNTFVTSIGGRAISLESLKPSFQSIATQKDEKELDGVSAHDANVMFATMPTFNDLSVENIESLKSYLDSELVDKIIRVRELSRANILDQIEDRKMWHKIWNKADTLAYGLSWVLWVGSGGYGLYSMIWNPSHGTTPFNILLISALGGSSKALEWLSKQCGDAAVSRSLDLTRLNDSINVATDVGEFELIMPDGVDDDFSASPHAAEVDTVDERV